MNATEILAWMVQTMGGDVGDTMNPSDWFCDKTIAAVSALEGDWEKVDEDSYDGMHFQSIPGVPEGATYNIGINDYGSVTVIAGSDGWMGYFWAIQKPQA